MPPSPPSYRDVLVELIDPDLAVMEDDELAFCLEAILPCLPGNYKAVPVETGVEVNIPDLIRKLVNSVIRERHDSMMFGGFLSEVYNEITCGQVSKPNTLPSEVLSVWQELERVHIAEAVTEALAEKPHDPCGA